ncbi:MAG: hypothetical protein Unbinned92contig1002_34 [Prokaryotic dsDNA virus sp.]|nr:MAG: hypothetical protein Unbinned92contig1002_34 [Prokaryotic dsDNA virus sp.]|tara:strand:- start:3517 stop:3834 length:318 start_codon:yes stop_codon:yes gene_type:complete
MKFILTILLFLIPLNLDYNQNKIKVFQINSKWNRQNSLDLSNLRNCEVDFGWYEDQPEEFTSVFKKVPVIIIFSNKKPVYKWEADISFKLNLAIDEVQAKVNNLK